MGMGEGKGEGKGWSVDVLGRRVVVVVSRSRGGGAGGGGQSLGAMTGSVEMVSHAGQTNDSDSNNEDCVSLRRQRRAHGKRGGGNRKTTRTKENEGRQYDLRRESGCTIGAGRCPGCWGLGRPKGSAIERRAVTTHSWPCLASRTGRAEERRSLR